MAKGRNPPSRSFGCYTDATAVTAGASALADGPTRGLFFGSTGSVTVNMADGTTGVVFNVVAAGSVLPISVTHVTASTATGVVALY